MGIRPEVPETFPVKLRRPWYAPNGHYYPAGYNELPVALKGKLPSTARTDDVEVPAEPKKEEPKTLSEAAKGTAPSGKEPLHESDLKKKA